jgi:NADH:ubiquinone oxidoreductase subunit E
VSAAGVGAAQPDEPERLAERLAQVFARFQGRREELIPLLQGVQEEWAKAWANVSPLVMMSGRSGKSTA